MREALVTNLRRIVPWLFLPLLALTAVLLLLVQAPGWEYQPVSSAQVFSNLPLFGGLYTLWLLLLLVLLWQSRSPWWGAALVVLFVLVHIGVFVIAVPNGVSEDWAWSADPVQILKTGRLDFVGYRDFPGLAILRAFLSSVTGVEVFPLRTSLLLFWLVALALLLFVGYSRLFRAMPVAVLAVLFALQSNIMLARFYAHPQYMGLFLIVAFLALLWGRKGHGSLGAEERLALILVVAAATMTHFVGSAIILSIAAGVYLEQRWRKQVEGITAHFVVLILAMILAWGIYWSLYTFPNIVAFLPDVGERLLQGTLFQYPLRMAGANTAPMPFWVNPVQIFWWVTIYLLAALLALRKLLVKERATSGGSGIYMAYLFLVGAWGLATIGEPTGSQIVRFILFGSFLAAPIVVGFLLEEHRARLLPLVLSGVLLVLSFPTMLAHNTNIAIGGRQPSEVASAQFLARAVAGREESIKLRGAYYGQDIAFYYSPGLKRRVEPFLREGAVILDIEELHWLWVEHVNGFLLDPARASEEAIFVFNHREVYYAQFFWGVPPDHPMWSEVSQLFSQTDRFYDDSRTQIYR